MKNAPLTHFEWQQPNGVLPAWPVPAYQDQDRVLLQIESIQGTLIGWQLELELHFRFSDLRMDDTRQRWLLAFLEQRALDMGVERVEAQQQGHYRIWFRSLSPGSSRQLLVAATRHWWALWFVCGNERLSDPTIDPPRPRVVTERHVHILRGRERQMMPEGEYLLERARRNPQSSAGQPSDRFGLLRVANPLRTLGGR